MYLFISASLENNKNEPFKLICDLEKASARIQTLPDLCTSLASSNTEYTGFCLVII